MWAILSRDEVPDGSSEDAHGWREFCAWVRCVLILKYSFLECINISFPTLPVISLKTVFTPTSALQLLWGNGLSKGGDGLSSFSGIAALVVIVVSADTYLHWKGYSARVGGEGGSADCHPVAR